jgi:glycosyltransferase involved in cell wall biosynthesis
MRILYFHQHFTTPQGSSGTRSYEFARALLACGHQVTMVCGTNDVAKLGLEREGNRDEEQATKGKSAPLRGTVDGIRVIALPVAYSNRDGIAKRVRVFAGFALRSAAIALREPCDLVFATSTPLTAAIPGLLAKWLRRKPFLFEVRDLWPELPRALGMKNPFLLGAMSLLEWLAYHAADKLIGLSPGIVEGIRKRAPADTPVAMIPNGCDLDLFKPTSGEERQECLRRAFPAIAPGDFVAGFTGAHGIANGLDAVLDAAAVLKQRGAAKIKFLFIGDGNRKDSLVERARRENLDNCIFAPPVAKTRLASFTAALDCGLMVLKNVPAFYYGTSPNKFFDYIAAGVPVLNNYPGWLADQIAATGCGVVIPPGDAEVFADALLRLAASPDANASRRIAARSLAERDFSREKLSADFVKFLT